MNGYIKTFWGLFAVIAVGYLHISGAHGAPSHPLRVWVMVIDPVQNARSVDEGTIINLKNKFKDRSVTIENTDQDLLLPSESDGRLSLGERVLDGSFLKWLMRFAERESGKEAVAVEFIRWKDAHQRISSAIGPDGSGSAPDVIQIGSTWVAWAASKGGLEDISRYFDDDKAGLSPLYSVPWFLDSRLLYYNKSLLRTEDVRTWDSFYGACSGWDRNAPKMIAFQTALDWNILHNLAPWLWAADGDILKEEKLGPFVVTDILLDSAGSQRAAGYLRDISLARCADFPEIENPEIERRFLAGKYASIVTGSWFIEGLGQNWQRKYGIVPLPAGPKGSVPFVGGVHLAVTRHAEQSGNLERAVALIKYLISEEVETELGKWLKMIPANPSARRSVSKVWGTDAFDKAVAIGRSYPMIPEWGEFIERDVVRDHIWHFWNYVAAGASSELVNSTLASAAREIKNRRIEIALKHYAPAGILAVICVVGALVSMQLRARKRYTRLHFKHAQAENELRRFEANGMLTETALLAGVEKNVNGTQDKLRCARGAELKTEISGIRQKQGGLLREEFGRISIDWDGKVSYRGKEIVFDNANQACRLASHIVRFTAGGLNSIHCLWGYPLFDWKHRELKSAPNRLFNTAVSKLNTPFKDLGLPPILVSSRRGSMRWRIGWEREHILQNSAAGRAIGLMREAKGLLNKGQAGGAAEKALTALKLDPTDLDAVFFVSESGIFEKDQEAMRCMKKSAAEILDLMRRLEAGLSQIELCTDAPIFGSSDQRDTLMHEKGVMLAFLEQLKSVYDRSFGGEKATSISPAISATMNRLAQVGEKVHSLLAEGVERHVMWSDVVQSEEFSAFTSMPSVDSVVNNIYNSDSGSKEDARLVKLALIMSIEDKNAMGSLMRAGDEAMFVKTLKRGVEGQLTKLESWLSAMPAY